MATIHNPITIPFTELSEPNKSPIENIQDDGMHATQYLKCAWEDRLELADQLRTEWTVTNGFSAFIIGHEYPHYDGSFVSSIALEGWGSPQEDSPGLMRWEAATLTVQYEPRPYKFDGGGGGSSVAPGSEVVYEEEFGFGSEFITVPNTNLYWDSANTPANKLTTNEAPGVMIRFNTWAIKYEVKNSLPSALHDLIGRVNNATVTAKTSGIVYPAQTLLYAGPQITHRRMSDGTDIYSVTVNFNDKPDGWNKFRKSATVAPQVVYKGVGSLYEPYVPASFAGLGT